MVHVICADSPSRTVAGALLSTEHIVRYATFRASASRPEPRVTYAHHLAHPEQRGALQATPAQLPHGAHSSPSCPRFEVAAARHGLMAPLPRGPPLPLRGGRSGRR